MFCILTTTNMVTLRNVEVVSAKCKVIVESVLVEIVNTDY